MKIIVSILSVTAWLAIEIMVILNPSETIPLNSGGPWFCTFFIGTPLFAFLLPFITSRVKERGWFFFSFAGSVVFLLLIALYGGYAFHRDFYVYPTQIVLLYLVIFFLRLRDFGLVRKNREIYYTLFIGTLVVFTLWISWLIMMSYLIVIRTEPRWIESTAYNLINGIIGLILLFSAVILREGTKRKIKLKVGNIFLDDRNISKMLSPQENYMLYLFLLASNHTLNCHELVEHMKKEGSENTEISTECDLCIRERWTVSSCSVYRNIKNRISIVKRYLELLQIGTIVPVSENTREIKESGWCMRLFDDVRWNISGKLHLISPHPDIAE